MPCDTTGISYKNLTIRDLQISYEQSSNKKNICTCFFVPVFSFSIAVQFMTSKVDKRWFSNIKALLFKPLTSIQNNRLKNNDIDGTETYFEALGFVKLCENLRVHCLKDSFGVVKNKPQGSQRALRKALSCSCLGLHFGVLLRQQQKTPLPIGKGAIFTLLNLCYNGKA